MSNSSDDLAGRALKVVKVTTTPGVKEVYPELQEEVIDNLKVFLRETVENATQFLIKTTGQQDLGAIDYRKDIRIHKGGSNLGQQFTESNDVPNAESVSFRTGHRSMVVVFNANLLQRFKEEEGIIVWLEEQFKESKSRLGKGEAMTDLGARSRSVKSEGVKRNQGSVEVIDIEDDDEANGKVKSGGSGKRKAEGSVGNRPAKRIGLIGNVNERSEQALQMASASLLEAADLIKLAIQAVHELQDMREQ
ncbi:hypothetical protein VNI00_018095 [Paramarasmius palmivorus]|uniref:Uncharacterized protein n=1 Tax=Paramarasmius palmivorus TaxID=297713 RepID=A0AAW0B2E3_9AGAR